MPETFGSPQLNDATAKREKRMALAARRVADKILEGQQVANRPDGSIPAPIEQQLADWQAMLTNPALIAEQLARRAPVIGPEAAAKELAQFDRDMQAEMDKRSNQIDPSFDGSPAPRGTVGEG